MKLSNTKAFKNSKFSILVLIIIILWSVTPAFAHKDAGCNNGQLLVVQNMISRGLHAQAEQYVRRNCNCGR